MTCWINRLVALFWAGFWLTGPALLASTPPYRPEPAIREILDALNRTGNQLDTLTRESAPEVWLQREMAAKQIIAPIAVGKVRDIGIPARNRQIPARIYQPAGTHRKDRWPIVIFVHGGGWTLGSIATYDSITRFLANHIPAIVVSVDYRLAPEYPYPAGLQDVSLATEWVFRNAGQLGGDPSLIAMAGDSGGGNLATIAARKARKEGIPIAFEALFYPSTDISRTDYPSYSQYGQGYLLTLKSIEAFRDLYLPKKNDWGRPDVSPLRANKEELARLPPTLIVVAGCDPLRDEGIAYAQKLNESGVKVTLRLKKMMVHGFLSFFNSATNPKVSAIVAPILTDISSEIRHALAAPMGR